MSEPETQQSAKVRPQELAAFANVAEPRYDAPEPERQLYLAGVEARQGAYMGASGTLTQFNAIVAAIHGSLLTGTTDWLLKATIATALMLHVLAAFVLCWAARPIVEKVKPWQLSLRRVDPVATAMADGYHHADDTFRNYRRGWRVTLLAALVSVTAASLLVLQAFGISLAPFLERFLPA